MIYKKASQKIVHDDTEILKYCMIYEDKYVKSSIVNKLDYAEFKKDLVISNGSIINKTTGEVLENVQGLSIEVVKESFEVRS